MSKNKKKILYSICTIIVTIVLLFIVGNTITNAFSVNFDGEVEESGIDSFGDVTDGVVGILAYGAKVVALVILKIIDVILSGIGSYAGGNTTLNLTPGDIIFNNLPITTINFFNTNTSSIDFITNLQSSVQLWYYIIRNISVIILLGILLYVGIRMAISTVASEEAKYKKMLIHWTQSLILVYVLQYIMIIVIDINNILVNVLAKAFNFQDANGTLDSVMTYLWAEAWSVSFTQGIGCTILYGMLMFITFLFLVMYLKRVIITAFLIIISPLITITYSIDKMGDGKSQALNNWLKEFVYNILIQPFHCIIYGALVLTAVNAISTDKSIATLVMTIIAMLFMFKAEDLVKKIFGVQPSSLGSVIAGSALALSAMNLLTRKNKEPKKSQGKMTNDKTPNFAGKDYPASSQNGGENPQDGNVNNNVPPNNAGPGGNNGGGTQGNGGPVVAPLPQQETKGRKALRVGGEILKGYAKHSAKVGTALAMAAMGAGTGDAKGVIAGYAMGASAAKGASNLYNSARYNSDTKENERVTAAEYIAWSQEQNIDNYEGLVERTQQIMNADLEKDNLTQGDLKYRQYLDSLTEQYKGGGEDEDSAKQHVLDTIRRTQMGQITLKDHHRSQGGYNEVENQRARNAAAAAQYSARTQDAEERARQVRQAAADAANANNNGNNNQPEMDSI